MAFGVKVQLGVDTSAVKQLRKDIQSAIDSELKTNPLKIKEVEFQLLKRSTAQLSKALQTAMDGTKLTLHVDKVDAKSLKAALNEALGGAQLDENGSLKIAPVVDTAGVKQINAVLNELSAAIDEISRKSANLGNLGNFGGSAGSNMQVLDMYRQQANGLLQAVDNAGVALERLSKTAPNMSAIMSQSGEVLRLMEFAEKFDSEKMGLNIDTASSVSALQKYIVTLTEYKRMYDSIFQTARDNGVEFTMPDYSAFEKASEAMKSATAKQAAAVEQYKQSSQEMREAQTEMAQTSLDPAKIADGLTTSMTGIYETLDSVRKKLEKTFDLSTIDMHLDDMKAAIHTMAAMATEVQKIGDQAEAAGKKIERAQASESKKSSSNSTQKQIDKETDQAWKEYEAEEKRLAKLAAAEEEYYRKRDEQRQASAEKDAEIARKAMVDWNSYEDRRIANELKVAEAAEAAAERERKAQEKKAAAAETAAKRAADAQEKLSYKAERLQKQITQWAEKNEGAYGEETKGKLQDLVDSLNDGNLSTDKLTRVRDAFSDIRKEVTELAKSAKLAEQASSLFNQIDEWSKANPTAYEKHKEAIDALTESLKDGKLDASGLKDVEKAFQGIQKEAEAAGETTQTVAQKVEGLWGELEKFASRALSLNTITKVLKEMYNNVVSLDSALTELRKVTDLTNAEAKEFAQTAGVIARNVGATISDTINATADFARLGYTVDEAAQLAQAALVYKNVGDGIDDISEATEALISAMKAFGYEADDAMSIVDKFNEVGNNFAISSEGVGTALQKSASALAAAGNTIDESIGLITAMNNVIQDPQAVGTTLKTMSMYLRAAKTEAEEAGIETDGMAESVSKLRDTIQSLTGIDIMVDDSTFKSTYQVVKELAEVWDTLTDTTQANVLKLIGGGNRNGNAVAALLSNWESAAKAAETSLNAAGSALAENEKYLDSIEGRISKLKAAIENISMDFINSDLIKTGVSALTGLVDMLDGLTKRTGPITALGTALLSALNISGKLKSSIGTTYTDDKKSQLQLTFGGTAWGDLKGAKEKVSAVWQAMTAGLSASSIKMAALNAGAKVLSATLQGIKNFAVSLLASLAVSLITKVIGSISEVIQKAKQAREDMKTSAKEQMTATQDLIEEYQSLWDALEDGSISESEFTERGRDLLKNLRGQGETVDDLIDKYGELGDSIDAVMAKALLEKLNDSEAGLRLALSDAEQKVPNSAKDAFYVTNAGLGSGQLYSGITNTLSRYGFRITQTGGFLPQSLNKWSIADGADINAIEDVRQRLYNLRDLMADLSEYAGVADTDIYTMIQNEVTNLQGLIDEYEAARADVEELFWNQTYFGYISEKGVPKTQAGFDAMRSGLIDSIDASGKFAEIGIDTRDAAEEFVDSMLLTIPVFSEFVKSIDDTEQATATSAARIKGNLTSMGDGIKSIQASYSALDKAINDMEDGGGITADTLMALMGELGSGERISDYITEEEGLLKLDVAAWQARTRAIQESCIEDLQGYIDALEEENAELQEKLSDEPEGTADYNEWRAQLDANNQAIEEARLEIAAYNSEIRSTTAKDYSDVLDVSDVTKQIDTALESLDKLEEYRDKLTSDTPEDITAGLLDLAKDFPEIISMWNDFDVESIDGQLALLDAVMDSLNETADATVDTKIALVDAALEDEALTDEAREALKGTLSYLYELKDRGLDGLKEKIEDEFDVTPITDATSAISKAASALTDLTNGDYDVLSMIETVVDMAKASGQNVSDFLSYSNGEFSFTEDAIRNWAYAYIDSLDETIGVTAEMKVALKEMVAAAEELDEVSITDATSAISKAASALTDLDSDDMDVLSMLETVSSMAEASGRSLSDYFEYTNGQFTFSKDAIKEYAYSYIESLRGTEGVTDDMIDALKAMVVAEAAAAEAADLLAESHEKVTGALGVSGSYGGYTQLTYDGFQSLIDVDKRYASAIEYQNGVLVLNDQKHAETTKKILEEQKAAALLAKQNIQLSDEYKNLVAAFKSGNISYDQLKRLGDLEMEIQGYNVLTHEIDAANSAYARWVNRKGDDGMDRYSQAVSAFKLINDTLNDKDSEYYGRVGREEFSQAVDFVIGEHVEVNTAEFDKGMKLAKRYLTEGATGATNFYDDLVSKGILDTTTGALNATIDEISDKLGLGEEMVRTMIDRLNEYQTEGHKITVVEPEVDEEAQNLLNEVTEALGNAEETLENINNTELEIPTGTTETRLKNVYDWLGKIATKVSQLSKSSINISTNVSGSTTTTSSSSSWLTGFRTAVGNLWSGLTGRASARGTVHSEGGKTLVGELGMETVVDPAVGKWYTVGAKGAEFVNLPKDAIVFNADQTRELFGKGHSWGSAMASGNAAASMDGSGGGGSGTSLSAWDMLKKALGIGGSSTSTSSSKAATTAKTTSTSTVRPSDVASSSGVTKPTSYTSPSSSGSSSSSSSGSSSSVQDTTNALEELNKQLEHLIAHQQHLYDVAKRGLNYNGMAESLVMQARIYRTMMESAQAEANRLIASGMADTEEQLQQAEEAAWSAYNSMNGVLDQLYSLYIDGLNEKIDGIQQAYSTLSTAAEEFNEAGGLSVDTFQSLIGNGIQYLSLLENENGQFVINKENIQKLIAAEKEQLAVESALSYIKQLREALDNKEALRVANLVDLTNVLSSSTWDYVYAQAAMLKAAGLTDEQFARVIKNIDALKAISAGVVTDITRTAESIKEEYDDELDALDAILKKTKELIKYETNEHIDAIEAEVDAYKEIIDLKKKSLKATKDEDEYAKSVAEKTKDIAELQAKIDLLALDDSREAQAQRMSLIEELKEAQEGLNDLQSEHAYELQTEALDKMADGYEELRQSEIDALEKSISSEEKLYQAAMQRLADGWETLYDELIAWNTEAGSSLNSEITENWLKAAEAVKLYGSYVEAVNALNEKASSSTDTETVIGNVVAEGRLSDVNALAAQGAANYKPTETSQSISTATALYGDSVTTDNGGILQVVQDRWNVRSGPDTSNKVIGVAKPGETFTYTGNNKDGWYEIMFNGQRAWIYGNGSKITKYHSGGVVGELGTSDDNEVMAVLKKGEMVITEKSRNALYKIIDFQEALSEKLGTMIGKIGAPLTDVSPMLAAGAGVGSVGGNTAFNPTINVSIGNVNGANDTGAKLLGEKIAQTAMDKLYDGFAKRGVSGVFGNRLKQ